jgi:hypothetical protein
MIAREPYSIVTARSLSITKCSQEEGLILKNTPRYARRVKKGCFTLVSRRCRATLEQDSYCLSDQPRSKHAFDQLSLQAHPENTRGIGCAAAVISRTLVVIIL